MFGFFKEWASNSSEIRRLQKELSALFDAQGINFMQLHPEIHKFLLGLAREVGSTKAVERFTNLLDQLESQSKGLSDIEKQQQLVLFLKSANRMAR